LAILPTKGHVFDSLTLTITIESKSDTLRCGRVRLKYNKNMARRSMIFYKTQNYKTQNYKIQN